MPFRVTLPLLVVAGFAAAGIVGGRREAVGDPGVIKIVSSLPRSGSARGQTDTIVNGTRLALDELRGPDGVRRLEVTDPETGEKRTFRIEYQDLDDATAAAGQWTIEQEIANANLARTDPDVMVYLGTYNSGASKVSMPILNRAHLLMVSPANTAESLTKPNTGERHEPACYRPSGEVNFFRVCPTDDLQSEVAAGWMKDLGVKRVYLLDDNEYYGKGIAAGLRSACPRLGITVLGSEGIDTKAQEFKPLMLKIKGQDPDLVYYAGTTQGKAGQLLKDMISVGLRCPMMAPDGCYENAMIESAGADAFEKVPFYVTFGGLTVEGLKAGGGRGAEFVRRYVEKFGGEPDEGYAVYGYESGLAAIECIRIAGKKDREAICKAATKIHNFTGATGTWSFDPNGDTTNQKMSGSTVRNGKFEFVKLLTRRQTPTAAPN
jgi:branched-chain amino acid transport system substrate-binding protein